MKPIWRECKVCGRMRHINYEITSTGVDRSDSCEDCNDGTARMVRLYEETLGWGHGPSVNRS